MYACVKKKGMGWMDGWWVKIGIRAKWYFCVFTVYIFNIDLLIEFCLVFVIILYFFFFSNLLFITLNINFSITTKTRTSIYHFISYIYIHTLKILFQNIIFGDGFFICLFNKGSVTQCYINFVKNYLLLNFG